MSECLQYLYANRLTTIAMALDEIVDLGNTRVWL